MSRRTRESCHRCGGPFERADDALVPVWRCRDCWREVPLAALPVSPARLPRRLLLTAALVPPGALAVLVALGALP